MLPWAYNTISWAGSWTPMGHVMMEDHQVDEVKQDVPIEISFYSTNEAENGMNL
jgi:hypothetical protein